MIPKDILNKIYLKNLHRENITTEELKSYGLSEEDFQSIITDNILSKIDDELYGISSFTDLYNFGVFLIKKEKYHHATNILIKCHKLNSQHLETIEHLLFLYIRSKNYRKAHEIIEKIINLPESKDNNIYNVYLYLINYNEAFPNKNYIKKIKNIKYKDLLLSEPNIILDYNNQANDLDTIIKIIGDIKENKNVSQIQKKIIEKLINQSQKKEKKFNKNILELVEQKKYQEIINKIINRNKEINLNQYYQNILKLTKEIIRISETKIIYKAKRPIKNNINLAIIYGDYYEALKLKIENNITDIEYLLLKEINELTINIFLNNIYNNQSHNIYIDNIYIELYQNHLDKAITLIKQYLKQINKEEYEYLILNLINISIQKKDLTYSKTINTLLELENNEYEYNISYYLQKFYSSLKNNRISIAKIYYNIIKYYSKELESILIDLEDGILQKEQTYNEEKRKIKKIIEEKIYEAKESNQPIFILENISPDIRKTYYQELEKIPNITTFTIGEEPKKIVVRILKPELIETDIVYHEIVKKYKNAYNEKNYNYAINITNNLLQNPLYGGCTAEVYAYLGLSHYHLKKYQESIKYFEIAEELSKKSKNNKVFNFGETILKIKKNIETTGEKKSSTEAKPYIQINENEFYDIENNFGITEIEDIAYFVKTEKISLEESCRKHLLTKEQIMLVKLIYARDYYIETMYQEGDKLLKEVEKSKDKTEKVKKYLEEIRKNKLFYKNRTNAHTRKKVINLTNNQI